MTHGEFMKQGKTPYEIRLDLLRLSFDILSTQMASKGLDKDGAAQGLAPTTDEVLAEARKLNQFVSQNVSSS